jgi:hypothetical protein
MMSLSGEFSNLTTNGLGARAKSPAAARAKRARGRAEGALGS